VGMRAPLPTPTPIDAFGVEPFASSAPRPLSGPHTF